MVDYERRTVLQGIGTVGAASVFGVGVASADDDGGEGEAKIRVAHAVPDAPDVDVILDKTDADVSKTITVGFEDVTGYLEVPTGEYEVSVPAANDFSAKVELAAEDYTAAATGNLDPENGEDDFGLDIFQDKLGVLDDGDGRVRVYHLSPDAGPVDVTASPAGSDVEVTIADGLTFGNAGPNFDVGAGNYDVTVTALDLGADVFSGTVTVKEGQVLSVFAEGEAFPEGDEDAFAPVLVYEEAAPFGGPGRGGDDEEEEEEEEEEYDD